MVKIEKESDIDLLNSSHYLIKKYLQKQFNLICKNYDCTNLSEAGAIFYLCRNDDLRKYKEVGLTLPYNEALYEASDLIMLNDGKSKITIFQAVYLLNNDMAITVIFDMNILDDLTKSWLLEDCTEMTVYL